MTQFHIIENFRKIERLFQFFEYSWSSYTQRRDAPIKPLTFFHISSHTVMQTIVNDPFRDYSHLGKQLRRLLS